jgi:hypothetical protein
MTAWRIGPDIYLISDRSTRKILRAEQVQTRGWLGQARPREQMAANMMMKKPPPFGGGKLT